MIVTLPPAARPKCLSPFSAMVAWVFHTPSETIFRSHAETIELENVVRRAYQRPFALHLLEATQQELPEATRLFDLSDHWFDDPFARGIDRCPSLRVQLAGHPIDDRGGLWQGSRGQGPGRSPCFCFRVEMYASMVVSPIASLVSSRAG